MVGTGIQWGGQTTLAARHAIEKAERVLFVVADPWASQWVLSLNPRAEQLPYPLDGRPRRQIYLDMVERILSEVRLGRQVCAVFYGHPGFLTAPGHEAVRRARSEGFFARMLPGVSSLDCLIADLGLEPGHDGWQVFEATNFLTRPRSFDVHTALILCQIGGIGNLGPFDPSERERIRRGLSALGELLRSRFPATHEAVIYEASVHPVDPPRIDRVTLGNLEEASVSELSTLYVPPIERAPLDARMATRLGLDGGDPSRT
ncbi:SAM-dependent methyltransferase [Polyangium sp. 6x1]|uniref:SAM-dependent methyltransferase n=1 Tax=Polyangium sp. 6x1 TaxID=3042689 RepID=UPI0024825885|nr:SAM-dependent methyltransferase [Polyangium sp. 6x1]MDI1449274.1 SAM-dependent methyltransferase [Polyangium sp. 6x1]